MLGGVWNLDEVAWASDEPRRTDKLTTGTFNTSCPACFVNCTSFDRCTASSAADFAARADSAISNSSRALGRGNEREQRKKVGYFRRGNQVKKHTQRTRVLFRLRHLAPFGGTLDREEPLRTPESRALSTTYLRGRDVEWTSWSTTQELNFNGA